MDEKGDFELRSTFLFSAILPPRLDCEDRTRMLVINLNCQGYSKRIDGIDFAASDAASNDFTSSSMPTSIAAVAGDLGSSQVSANARAFAPLTGSPAVESITDALSASTIGASVDKDRSISRSFCSIIIGYLLRLKAGLCRESGKGGKG